MNEKHENENFLDKKIAAIQKSTSTKNQHLQKINEFLRQRFRWYYDLRVNPRYAAKDLDDQIMRIQNSTKTRIRRLQPAHDHLRQRFDWYYGWHLRPFSSTLHIATAVVYTCSVSVFCFYFVFSSSPGISSAKRGDPKTEYEQSANQQHSNNSNTKNEKENKNDTVISIETEEIAPPISKPSTDQGVTTPNNMVTPEGIMPGSETTPLPPDSQNSDQNIANPPNPQEQTNPNAPEEATQPEVEPTPKPNTTELPVEAISPINNTPTQNEQSNSSDITEQSINSQNPNDYQKQTPEETDKKANQGTVSISVRSNGNSIILEPQTQTTTALPVSEDLIKIVAQEVKYGTKKERLDKTYAIPPSLDPQTINLPDLKARTYYYQVVTIGDQGERQYSEVNTIKSGNQLIRFIADGLEWLKEKIIGEESVVQQVKDTITVRF